MTTCILKSLYSPLCKLPGSHYKAKAKAEITACSSPEMLAWFPFFVAIWLYFLQKFTQLNFCFVKQFEEEEV